MRGLWWAAAGLLLMMGLCVAAGCYVQGCGARLSAQAAAVQEALEQEDWSAAEGAAGGLRQEWQRQQGRLGCLTDHGLLREVETNLAQLRCRMRLGQAEEAAAVAAELVSILQTLGRAESVGLDNIL